MILSCVVHDEQRRVPFGDEGVSEPVVDFFRQHRQCFGDAGFDLDEH